MGKVMDCVVETQLKRNTMQFATEFGSFVFLVTDNLVTSVNSRVGMAVGFPAQVRGFKTTWSGKLSDSYTTAVCIYYKTRRRNCRC